MNDKRKKIVYSSIIVGCLIIMAVFLLKPKAVPPATSQAPTPTLRATTPRAISSDPSTTQYATPAVFPLDTQFFTTALDSSKFQSLKPYDSVTVSPEELQRDDPFAGY